MPRSVINAYERGGREPGADALAHIAAAAGMELRVGRRPSVDLDRAGRVLDRVLDFAEALPHRKRGELSYPYAKWRELDGLQGLVRPHP